MSKTHTVTPEAYRQIDFAHRICVRDLYLTQSALQGISDLIADSFNDELEPIHEFTGPERNTLLHAAQALSRHLAVDLEGLDNALSRALGQGAQS